MKNNLNLKNILKNTPQMKNAFKLIPVLLLSLFIVSCNNDDDRVTTTATATPTPTATTPQFSYLLMRCSDNASFVSAIYDQGTFSSGERVQSGSGTIYIILGTTSAQAGLSITTTGLTGCP